MRKVIYTNALWNKIVFLIEMIQYVYKKVRK